MHLLRDALASVAVLLALLFAAGCGSSGAPAAAPSTPSTALASVSATRAPGSAPSPTATATAQTPPTIHSAISDLAVETVLSLPGAVPIVRLTWSAPADYTGDFQIEHARIDSANPTARHAFALIATVPASTRLPSGSYVYEESDVRGIQTCYRLRTLVAGVAGPSTAEVCVVNPLPTGPGPTIIEPPNAGGGKSARPASVQYQVSLLGIGGVLVGLSLVAAFCSCRGAGRQHRG